MWDCFCRIHNVSPMGISCFLLVILGNSPMGINWCKDEWTGEDDAGAKENTPKPLHSSENKGGSF